MKAKELFKEVSDCFLRVIELKQNLANAYHDLSSIHKMYGCLEAGPAGLAYSLALSPNTYAPTNNRRVVLSEMNRPDEVLVAYDRAISLSPELTEPRSNKSYLFKT